MNPAGTGKIAAITGAASGIGQAACRRLLHGGWTVFGMDVAQDRLQAVRDEFSDFQTRFKPVACDVTNAASVTDAFAGIGGSLNALVCCAGVLRTSLMEHMTVEDFDLVLNTNLRGTFLSAQKALPLLRQAARPDRSVPDRAAVIDRGAAAENCQRRLCRIESRCQPALPGDGGGVGAVRRAGECAGARNGRYADGAGGIRSGGIEGIPAVRRVPGRPDCPAG